MGPALMPFRHALRIRAPKPGLHMITRDVEKLVRESGVQTGLCNLFIRHTSASLTINENADPAVRDDLNYHLDKIAPRDDPNYTHTLEGSDDMPSHIKSSLTGPSLSIPVIDGRLGLGTWQGIYLWEHRDHPTPREIIVSIF